MNKTRAEAWELLNRFTKNQNLIKHSLAVEAAMRHYAQHFGEEADVWGMVGLLHDFDYEQFPSLNDHPYKGQEILAQAGYSAMIRQGIMAHAPHTGTAHKTRLHQAIFAVDELTGFIVGVAMTRPNKTLAEVTVASIKKKMKQRSFCAAVSRDDIRLGAQELGLTIDEHIQHVLTAMQLIHIDLDL